MTKNGSSKKINKLSSKVHEIDYSEYHEKFDPLTVLFDNAEYLVGAARGIQSKDAESYRNFLVGACALMNNVQDKKLRVYVGFNSTPKPGDPKYCAEMRAIGRAIGQGFTQCEAIVVTGTTDMKKIEEVNHERTPTLLPCNLCLKIIDEAAVIVSVGEDQDIYEANTCSQIRGRRYAMSHTERKARRRGEVVTPIRLIEDPGFVQWAGGRAMYEELTQDLEAGPNNGLRLARAELAVVTFQAAIAA